MNNIYLPEAAKILSVERVTPIEWLFRVQFNKPVKSGQFIQISIPKVGEAPISIANFNEKEGWIDFLIRKVGKVTDEIFNKRAGEKLFLRGPYGNGFPVENFENKHLVIVAGGSGIAPVRPIIEYFYENREKLKSFRVIAGFKDLESVIFKDDFTRWRKKIDVLVTLDKACSLDGICDGLVTKYIPETILPADLVDVEYVIVGPPVMMKFSCQEVLKRGISKEKIWVSFERKMSCAVGKCGHCKIDETYICLEGPVFKYDFAEKLLD